MKVAAFSDLYPPLFIGGYEIGAAHLLAELRRRGHETLVLSSHEYIWEQPLGLVRRERLPEDRDQVLDTGLCYIGNLNWFIKRQPLSFLQKAFRTWRARHRYRAALRAFQPDLLLVFNPLGTVAPVIDDFTAYSRDHGTPVWTYVSDSWLAGWPSANPLWLALHKIHHHPSRWVRLAGRVVHKVVAMTGWVPDGSPSVDGYFYCSDFIRKISRDNSVGIAGHAVIHWGLPRAEQLPCVSKDHFISRQPLTFLYAGQVLDHKGLHVLLQALPLCRAKNHLVVIGDDTTDYAARCKRIVARLDLTDRVRFLGKKRPDEVHRLLVDSGHALIVPSMWDEPFSIVVLEGMGLGLPVVVSKTGGSPEAIRHGENGFLFPRGDSRALAAILDQLELDRDLCAAVGARARRDVLRSYTMPGMVDAMLAQIDLVATRKSVPLSRAA